MDIVSDKDKEFLPVLIRAFAAKDLVDYYRYDHPPKTDLSRLATIYDIGLERVDSYFAGLSPHVATRPKGHARKLKPPAPDDGV